MLGDSLVVVQDENICKVHVHTNRPGRALEHGQKYGEFVTLKIENMQEQHNSLMEQNKAPDRPKIENAKARTAFHFFFSGYR